MTFAGIPTDIVFGGISPFTTELAPIIAPLPIFEFDRILWKLI